MKNLLRKLLQPLFEILGLYDLRNEISKLKFDVLTIMEKQIAMQSPRPNEDSHAIPPDEQTTIMNMGNHEWRCMDCNLPFHACKAGKVHSILSPVEQEN